MGDDTLAPTTDGMMAELVDNDLIVPRPSPQEEELQDDAVALERRQLQGEEQAELAAAAIPRLRLSAVNLARGQQVRKAFEDRDDDGDEGERLLEELTAAEVPIALQLQDIEGALTAMLGKAVLEPEAALQVARVLKETVALSGAVRTRMQNCLSAAANLRAQRKFLALHRGRVGV